MSEPRFIARRLAAGTTTRRAIACTVEGTALLGPATFPSERPETFAGETAEYHMKLGWCIRPGKPGKLRIKPGNSGGNHR